MTSQPALVIQVKALRPAWLFSLLKFLGVKVSIEINIGTPTTIHHLTLAPGDTVKFNKDEF